MSTRLSANSPKPFRRGVAGGVILLVACLCLILPGILLAEETIIVSLQLNQQSKGDIFVVMRDDGDFLVRISDLEAAGLRRFPEATIDIDGEPHVSLSAIPDLKYHFEEASLTLQLNVAPEQLSSSTIDLLPQRRKGVIYPHDNSLFLNYGLEYTLGGSNDFDFEGVGLSNELGVRYRDLLLLNSSHFSNSTDGSSFVRLNTRLTWDDRARLRRFVGGDFVARSGDLGSLLQMAGVSVSKRYRIDPYFISYPLFDFSGVATLPSEVELYVGGAKVSSEKIAPGEFELRNYQGLGGAQSLEVVVRDALGREQRISAPFYFSDQLLRRGLHEYSYNLGFLRKNFGQESNSYSDLALVGFHRYGLSDELNVGLRSELGGGLVNFGFESAYKPDLLGLFRLQGAGSFTGDHSGGSGLFSYEYYNRRFRGRLALQLFSEGYRTLETLDAGSRRKLSLLAGVGYVNPRFGSFSLDFSRIASYTAEDRDVLTFSWSRRVWRRAYANASLRRISETDTRYEAGFNLSWYFGNDRSVSGSVRRENGDNLQMLEARQNTPVGAGTGWAVRGERGSGADGQAYQLSGDAQHNARQLILRGDASIGHSAVSSTEDLRLAVSGAVVYLGDSVKLTRPVNDSFALVSVGNAEGVGVYVNGQQTGHTDSHGQLVIPELSSYYENQIYIEDQDVPFDYLIPKVRLFVSPPLRSGSCVNFPLHKYQGFSGTMMSGGRDAAVEPLGYAELTLFGPAGELHFWSGRDGEFYFDNQQDGFVSSGDQGCSALQQPTAEFLPPGSYRLMIRQEERTFESEIAIPTVTGPLTELGEVLLPHSAQQ